MTPDVYRWAIRHGVGMLALHELADLFRLNGGDPMPPEVKGVSEAAVQSAVRLEAARKGVRLWRNNVGALKDSRGVPVRYGLANDSAQLNRTIKSGDLIGWRPVLITDAHVGSTVAQFVSRECKAVGWRYTGTEHEAAQLAWAKLVTAGGGDAAFCCGTGTL